MLPQEVVDVRRTGPIPLRTTDDDADLDDRPTNPYVVDPTAEYVAGYFRRTDPMLRDPANEDTEILVLPRRAGASATIVFSSVFLLCALGLGAFLLMYSAVHGGERNVADMAPEYANAPSAPASPPESQTATIGTVAPQSKTPPDTAPAATATLAPLPSVLLAEPPAPVQPPVAPIRTAVAPAPADTAEANPYDDKPLAAAPRPIIATSAKVPVVIHVEPNPVKNPYEGTAEDTTKAPSAE
jgi:hypothetical protein